MNASLTSGIEERAAILRQPQDLPIVSLPDGTAIQLAQVDLAAGVWVVRSYFPPGTTVQKHRHTGHVYAFTLAGSWYYLETPEQVSTAGSYLYEPAGSVHTLYVPDTNQGMTDVWFAIHGANLKLDADGAVEAFSDASTVLEFYVGKCRDEHGVDPPVVVIGA
jgi:quercetin dioxygenase-like cupin family protein